MYKPTLLRAAAALVLATAQSLFAVGTEAMVVNLSDRDWQLKTLDTMSHLQDHDLDTTLVVRNLKTGAHQDWAVGATEIYTLHKGEAITFHAKNPKPMTKYSLYNRIQLVDHMGHPAATLATVLWMPASDPTRPYPPLATTFDFHVDQAMPNILVQAYSDGPVVITGNEAASSAVSSAAPAAKQ